MKFANLTDRKLCFDMSGVCYEVESGAEVDIPDAIAYGVKSRGLPLTPSSEVTPAAKPVAPKSAEPLLVAEEPKPKTKPSK